LEETRDHASYNEIGAGRSPLVLNDPGGPLAAEDAESLAGRRTRTR
jgi:hypothetical protein